MMNKILLIAGSQLTGGAAKATLNLAREFEEDGFEVKVAHMDYNRRNEFSFVGLRNSFLHKVLINLDRIVLGYVFASDRKEIFSLSIKRNVRLQNLIDWADNIIVNFYGLGTGSLNQLEKTKTNISFIMRDDWFITGGCHYINSCDHFDSGCLSCPKVPSYMRSYVAKAKKRKAGLMSRDNFTTMSINTLHKSKVPGVSIINNTINSAFFTAEAVEKSSYIVASAINWKNPWKGYELLVQLANSEEFKHRKFVIIGKGANHSDFKFSNVDLLGSVQLQNEYINLISRAKAFLLPSSEEAFGKVGCEAIALGTPVVSWEGTGSSQYLIHNRNSIMCPEYSLNSFKLCLAECLCKDWDFEQIRISAMPFKTNLDKIKSSVSL